MGLPILSLAALGFAVTLQVGCLGGTTDEGLGEDQSSLHCGGGYGYGYGYGYGRRCGPPTYDSYGGYTP